MDRPEINAVQVSSRSFTNFLFTSRFLTFRFFSLLFYRSFVHLYHAFVSFYLQQFIEKSLLNLIVLCSFSVLAIIASATLTLTYVHRTAQIFVDSMRAYRKSLILVTSSIRLFSRSWCLNGDWCQSRG